MRTHFWQPEFGMRSPKIRLYTSIIRQRTWTIYHNLMAPNHFQSGPQLPRTAPDFFGLDEQSMNFWNQGNGIACKGAMRRMLTLNRKGTKPSNYRCIMYNTCEKQHMQHRTNHILYLDLGLSCQLLRNPIKPTPRLFTTLSHLPTAPL